VKKLSQTEISSILNRRNSQTEEAAQQSTGGLTLDQFYIALANASQADYDAGLISGETFRARVAELKAQYRAIKAR
jgi:hypothetical protein